MESPRKDYVGNTSVGKLTLDTVVANDTVTINGLVYTGVTGAKADNTEFSVDTSDTAAATDLADSISNDVRVGTIPTVELSAASSGARVVIVGTGENSNQVTMESSDPATIVIGIDTLVLNSLESNIADNNPTLKQVNFMNTPFSVQQSGADKVPGRLVAVTTAAQFNALTVRQRVLNGSREGWISAHTDDTSLVFTFYDVDKNEIDETFTMAQIFANGDLFVINENY